MKIELLPIAYVKNTCIEIADDYWGGVVSEVTLTDDFDESALKGIEDFSHLEIVFYFDKVENSKVQTWARRPRNNPDWPVTGIFAQRVKNRPNQIGLSIAKIVKLDGKTLLLTGLDAIDGTPVLDIKPVIKEFFPRQGEEIRQPSWATELMQDYWKKSTL